MNQSGDLDISKDLMKDSEFINELAQKISRTDKSINHVSIFWNPRFEVIHV